MFKASEKRCKDSSYRAASTEWRLLTRLEVIMKKT